MLSKEEFNRIRMPGGKEHTLIRVKKSMLATLFGVSKWTIDSWSRSGKLDIRSLESICTLYAARAREKNI